MKRTRMNRVNSKRRKRLREKQFGEQAERCRNLPCCACGAPPPSDPHHVPSRGAGGVDRDCCPLCRECHRYFHDHGERSFAEHFGVEPRAVARSLRTPDGG